MDEKDVVVLIWNQLEQILKTSHADMPRFFPKICHVNFHPDYQQVLKTHACEKPVKDWEEKYISV